MAKIYSLGHSTRNIQDFVAILRQNRISLVVDARSVPFSKYAPQFNRYNLEHSLKVCGLEYVYRGRSIGGRGINRGQNETLDELARAAMGGVRMAIICAEKSHLDCHRYTMLAPLFKARGIEMEHLDWDVFDRDSSSSDQSQMF